IRRGSLDWDYILATARRHGALAGLGCYLSYVDQIHRDVFWQPLVAEPMRGVLGLRGWGRVEFRAGGYRFPILRVNSRLYVRQLGSRIAARDWTAATRLFLIPVVAAARAFRRLAQGLTSASAPPRGIEKTMTTADAPLRVVTFRGDDVQGIVGWDGITLAGRVLQLACRIVARWADAAIVVSEHMKDYLPRSVRPHVIPSGLDLNLFRVIPRDEARGRLGLA